MNRRQASTACCFAMQTHRAEFNCKEAGFVGAWQELIPRSVSFLNLASGEHKREQRIWTSNSGVVGHMGLPRPEMGTA